MLRGVRTITFPIGPTHSKHRSILWTIHSHPSLVSAILIVCRPVWKIGVDFHGHTKHGLYPKRSTVKVNKCFIILFSYPLSFLLLSVFLSVCLSVCPFSSYVSLFTFFFLFYHSWLLFLYFLCVDCCMSSCSLSPGKAARISRALHWDKKESLQNTSFSAQYIDLIGTNAHTRSPLSHPALLHFLKNHRHGLNKTFLKEMSHATAVFSLSEKINN